MYNNQVMTATHDNVKIATKTITSYLNYIGGIQSTCTVLVAATVVPRNAFRGLARHAVYCCSSALPIFLPYLYLAKMLFFPSCRNAINSAIKKQ